LSSREDWDKLGEAVGGVKAYNKEHGVTDWIGAGKKLKSKSGWNIQNDGSGGNGTDDYGFSALPEGFRFDDDDGFVSAGSGGYWWASMENKAGWAYTRLMFDYSDDMEENGDQKSFGYSVRCVSDGSPSKTPQLADGTWLRSYGGYYYQLKINGDNWVYSEGPSAPLREISRGTWSGNTAITAAPATGTITLTITQFNQNGNWINLTPEYNSVKVNTAAYELDASGTVFTISNASLTTEGVWAALEGVYKKQ
jgi:uncharacterized protein (TIGR02145 family)